MITFLLLTIVAILLFGAVFVRGIFIYALLALLGLFALIGYAALSIKYPDLFIALNAIIIVVCLIGAFYIKKAENEAKRRKQERIDAAIEYRNRKLTREEKKAMKNAYKREHG